MSTVINAALIGAGTVGGGLYRLQETMSEEIEKRVGAKLNIKKVLVRDASKKREGIDPSVMTTDWNEIINDHEIQIVIELMGGTTLARERILEALEAGKNVVTANKDLIAEHGEEIFEKAQEKGLDVQFEAAVAGAIPIIRPIMQNMDGDNITEVMGIVNGTTNYILTKMSEEGLSYEKALADATELGYAEADPTADVEGIDAARKVAIISQLIFHTNVTLDDVYKEGISKITSDDISYAKDFGYVIKLVGTSKMTDGKIEARVHPLLIDEKHPLASVRDSFNAVYVLGDALDAAMFMGRGAGDLPTASAVLGDVIDVMRNIMNNCTNRVPVDYYNNYEIMPIDNVESKFFLKTVVDDKPGVLALIAGDMAENGVSVKKVVQKNARDGVADLVFITDTVEENKFMASVKAIKELDSVKEISSIIRVK